MLHESFYKRLEELKQWTGIDDTKHNVKFGMLELDTSSYHAYTVNECIVSTDDKHLMHWTDNKNYDDYKIITRQLGTRGYGATDTKEVESLIKYAKDRGTIFIDAAGNDNMNINKFKDTQKAKDWIQVGSSRYMKPHWLGVTTEPYSNYGDEIVEFCYPAPASGTSFSTPFFANVIIKLVDIFPEITQDEVVEVLKKNIRIPNENFMYGMPNLIKWGDVVKVSLTKAKLDLICPVKDGKITSKWGDRIHPITNKREFHSGVDYVSDNRNIYSATDGTVKLNGFIKGMGNRLVINTNGYDIYYCHLAKIPNLKKGDKVKQGDVIAEMGTTGDSTGIHLHFEIRLGGFPNFTTFNPILSIKGDDKMEVSEWAKIAQQELVKFGITDGTRPKDNVTREELWTMLWRMMEVKK